MEKNELKRVDVWRMGIQGNAASGYAWNWSPEFPTFDALITAYKDWLAANPMRRIQFRKEFKYIPA